MCGDARVTTSVAAADATTFHYQHSLDNVSPPSDLSNSSLGGGTSGGRKAGTPPETLQEERRLAGDPRHASPSEISVACREES